MRRNRVECSIGAVCPGKPVVFKSGRFEGKNWIHHPAPRHHQTLTDRRPNISESSPFPELLQLRIGEKKRRDLDGCAESSSGPHKPQVIQRRPSPHRHAAVQAGRAAAVTRAQPLCPAAALAGPRRGPFSGKNAGRARTRARHLDGGGPSRRRSGSGDGRAAESVPICAAARAGLLLQR